MARSECACDGAVHNQIVNDILRDHGAKSLIKSKSMLTEECGFRPYMASVGIEVIETDLGERIQQLDKCVTARGRAPPGAPGRG